MVGGQLVQRQVAQPAVFEAADAVFGAGPAPVAQLEVGEAAAGRVGGEQGDPPAVGVGQAQLRAGVWRRSRRAMIRIPAGQP